tara:strand:+ start:2770 stop:2955 length:186 start_codon:yes stop_codon:yes gene_type:complete
MRKKTINDYTIMEYDEKTQKYTTIGHAFGETSEEAKQAFITESKWKPKRNTILFARIPLCR